MKTQFYYALLDIGSEWRKIIKFIFQMLLSLLAFMYIVSSIFQQLGFSQWLQGKADYEHTYMLYDADTADVERLYLREKKENLSPKSFTDGFGRILAQSEHTVCLITICRSKMKGWMRLYLSVKMKAHCSTTLCLSMKDS